MTKASSSPDNRPGLIASRNHPVVKRVRALQGRGERERTGQFYVEGIRFVAQAIERNAYVETLILAPGLLTHAFGRKLARTLRQAGVPAIETTPEVFHSLSLADEPQGIGAIVRQRWEPLGRIEIERGLCWVALDAVRSPGNLGTVLRTCDAVGAAGVILLGEATDPYDPATVRASMGALFALQFARVPDAARFAAWKRRNAECLLVGTSPTGCEDYQAVAYRPPVVLLMGEERAGLGSEMQALCDVVVRIPMLGRSDSLNLGVATSVLLYEVFNQRRRSEA